MKKLICFLIPVILISGCVAMANRINVVKIGMTREEVINKVGKPVSKGAQGATEYFNYRLFENYWGYPQPYYVRFVDDKVDSYGKLGDFDSTQKPTIKIEKDENIRQDANVNIKGQNDMYVELMKLKELKDKGILVEEEYAREKKEILQKY